MVVCLSEGLAGIVQRSTFVEVVVADELRSLTFIASSESAD